MSAARPVAALVGLVLAFGGCLAAPSPSGPPPAVATPSPPLDRAPVEVGPEVIAAGHRVRPSVPLMVAVLRADLVADHCTDRDLPARQATDPALTILDRSYALAPDEVPPDLVPLSEAGFAGGEGARLLRAVVVADLIAMRDAWQAAGMTVTVDSAYRSYADQQATFDYWVGVEGPAAALLRTARPGHSEHQLGTAIDVSSPGWFGRFGDWAVESAEGAWMAEHAWEFGFVMSYPPGTQAATCFGYEPWHYRWIGREAAAAHRASGLSLRRFLERFIVG